MTPSPGSNNRPVADGFSLVARLVLGGLFVYMGLSKVLDPVDFLKLVRQYNLVEQPFLLNSIAALLPWFELFCGVLLVAGVAVRGAALISLAMLVPFTLVVFSRAWDIHTTQSLAFCAIKFDCGCGGGEVLICRKLVENSVLMVLGAWLLFQPVHRWALRPSLTPTPA